MSQMEKDPRSGNNQISKLNYAMGYRTEQVNKNPLVVMVAEKPSIALSITEALSHGKYSKGKGFSKLPTYIFSGIFKGY